MPEKRYWMSRPRWAAVPPGYTHFAWMDAASPIEGIVSLTVISGMAQPLLVQTPEGTIEAIGNGYHWVQLAPRGERWWLTAMFDRNRQLVQFYFDITFGNHLLPDGGSWFRDAYLDVVLEPCGRMRLLDEDELDAAVAGGAVSREMADRARADAAAVMARFAGRGGALETLCRGYLEALLPQT